jgi:hypothetical protein
MRKWARDSERHGIQIGLYNRRGRSRGDRWEGGGTAVGLLERFTDDEGLRIIDGPHGIGNGPRTVDGPYPWAINNAVPVLLLADDGTTRLTDDTGALQLLA